MSDFKEKKLGDVADVKLSNVDKKTHYDERVIRLCNYTDVYKNQFIDKKIAANFMLASCNESEYEKFILRKGQVAITKDSEKRDDIGISTYIAESFKDVILGYHLALITPNDKDLNGQYLNYWFNTPQAKRYFENNVGGSGQRFTLPLDIIRGIPIVLPAFSIQRQIASVLSSLDDKIELNNRINAELEQMARTLYDYWFVQFDFPDKNGKPYKSSGGKMVYNETLKRKIPKGWKVKKLEEKYEISNESLNPQDKPNVVYKHYSIPVWDSTSNYGLELGSTINSNKFIVSKGSILVSKLNPWFNRVIYNTDENDMICSTEFVVINANNKLEKAFLKQVFTSKPFINYLVFNATGTSNSHKRVNPQNLMKFSIPYDLDIITSLGVKIYPLLEKIEINKKQSFLLTSIRDWLLPMLMNGQVKVVGRSEARMSIAAEPMAHYGNG